MNQTYSNIELILVDDGSPDMCGEMCDNYKLQDSRVKVVHKPNGGLSSARNAGILVSSGKYLSFVDSDDWISLDMIEYMVDLSEKKNADIVSVSYILSNNENQQVSSSDKIKVMNRNQALEYFLNIGMTSRISDYPVCIKLIKRSLFDGIEFPVGTLYEDYTTNVQLIKKCDIYVKSSKICYFYYQGGQSIVRSYYKRQDNQLLSQCEKVCDYVKNETPTIIKLANEKLARSYLSLLVKITVYGFSNEFSAEDRKQITKKLTSSLRLHIWTLIKSHMPISRKVILVLFCIDYRPFTIIRKVKK